MATPVFHKDLDTAQNEGRMAMFASLSCIAQGIAQLLGPHAEVVVHDVADVSKSVVCIVNGHVTGRRVGSPMTDFGLRLLQSSGFREANPVTYSTRLDDGRLVRSTTMPIFARPNDPGSLYAMMCVNVDMSAPLVDYLATWQETPVEREPATVESFPTSVSDLVRRIIASASSEAVTQSKVPAQKRTAAMLRALNDRGVFAVKGANELVAEQLGISRHTVYHYVRAFRRGSTPEVSVGERQDQGAPSVEAHASSGDAIAGDPTDVVLNGGCDD